MICADMWKYMLKGTSALRTAKLVVRSVKKAIPTRRTQGIPWQQPAEISLKGSRTPSKFPSFNENGQKSHFLRGFLTQNLINILSRSALNNERNFLYFMF